MAWDLDAEEAVPEDEDPDGFRECEGCGMGKRVGSGGGVGEREYVTQKPMHTRTTKHILFYETKSPPVLGLL